MSARCLATLSNRCPIRSRKPGKNDEPCGSAISSRALGASELIEHVYAYPIQQRDGSAEFSIDPGEFERRDRKAAGLGPTDTKTRWDHFAAALQVFVDYFRWFTVKPDVGADSSLIEMAIRASRKHRILGSLSTLLRHLPAYTERPVRRMGQEARDVRHGRKTEGLLFRSPLWLAVPYQTSSHTQCATYSLSENALGALSRLMVRMRCASHPALDRFLG